MVRHKIQEAREAKGLNRSQLAKLAGTSTDTVRRAEEGPHTPAFTVIARIAEVLDIPLDSLHEREAVAE